jgi:hypothetical protein
MTTAQPLGYGFGHSDRVFVSVLHVGLTSGTPSTRQSNGQTSVGWVAQGSQRVVVGLVQVGAR